MKESLTQQELIPCFRLCFVLWDDGTPSTCKDMRNRLDAMLSRFLTGEGMENREMVALNCLGLISDDRRKLTEFGFNYMRADYERKK